MKKQIVIIHGGETFSAYEDYLKYLKNYEIDFEKLKRKRWKDNLAEELKNDFEIIRPQMPSPRNAKYQEWKIWFEKFFPILRDSIILIGHSLGGMFLAKYLSENNFPVKINQLYLVAAPFDGNRDKYSLTDFKLSVSLKNIEKQISKIFLYHSKDDPVVPFSDLEKYASELPSAKKIIFKDRDHFSQEEFPELVERIKNDHKFLALSQNE